MKWGTKWGKNPVTNTHAYWGKLLNDIVQSAAFSQAAQAELNQPCDTAFVVIPSFGTQPNTTFTFPYTTPTRTLALRNPKFGDILTIETEGLVRRNRTLQVQTYKDYYWPTFESVKITIEKLSQANITSFITFIAASAGLPVGMLDHKGRHWQGFIVTEDIDIIQTGQGTCNYEITLVFLGAPQ